MIDCCIGVRQGSCEGPVLFLFMMQAIVETIQWPAGIVKPSFCTALVDGKLKEPVTRTRAVEMFVCWAILYADDLALLFESRDDLREGLIYLRKHIARFGLQIHVGREGIKSKTVAMFCPSKDCTVDDVDLGNIELDNGGNFIPLVDSAIYLGTVIESSCTSEVDVNKRILAAQRAFNALRVVLTGKDIRLKTKG